jgi:hypothetical protein
MNSGIVKIWVKFEQIFANQRKLFYFVGFYGVIMGLLEKQTFLWQFLIG